MTHRRPANCYRRNGPQCSPGGRVPGKRRLRFLPTSFRPRLTTPSHGHRAASRKLRAHCLNRPLVPTACPTHCGGCLPPTFSTLLDHIRTTPTVAPILHLAYPEGGTSGHTDGLTIRTAAALRPLVLMQTRAKLIAYVVNEPLGQFSEQTVCGQQRGFVRHRDIADNVIELEGYMATSSQAAGRCAVGLLLDFANAFPSLDHGFMWAVLEAMGLPDEMLQVIKLLYHELYAEILYKGQVVGGFPILSGIKKGCPLSGALFALTLDPLIRRYLSELALRSSCICAFADNIGLALLNVYAQLPPVLRIFALWARATGLQLKIPKCVLIPLFDGIGDLQAWLARQPEIRDVAVQSFGRYLGIEVGPGAHDAQWGEVVRKMRGRIGEIRNAGKSLAARVFMFNSYVSSVFGYKAQFSDVPPKVLQAYKNATQQITRAPWQAIPYGVLVETKAVGMPVDLRDVVALSTAAKCGVLGRSRVVHCMWARFDDFQACDGASLSPARAWYAQSVSQTLRRCSRSQVVS